MIRYWKLFFTESIASDLEVEFASCALLFVLVLLLYLLVLVVVVRKELAVILLPIPLPFPLRSLLFISNPLASQP